MKAQNETSRPTLEESFRGATTQRPITNRGFTRISRAGIPKRPLPNCQAGPTASSTPLRIVAQMPCSGHSWAGPLTTSLQGLWVSGYLPRAMADRAQGRRPDNRPCGDDSHPERTEAHARPALSSTPGGLTPHSARSSNRARQLQLIRAELPSNGYPQPSGSSKNARQWHFIRAERSSNGSCRSHRALEGSSLPSCFCSSFSSSVAPLWPLGLGILGRGSVRSLIYFYDVTDAGRASHRVRLWQRGPASTILAVRRSIV